MLVLPIGLRRTLIQKTSVRGSVTAAIVNLRGVAPLKNDEKDQN